MNTCHRLGNTLLENHRLENHRLENHRLENNLLSQNISPAELSEWPTLPPSEGEPIKHILLGSPGGVRQTIHLLHTLRYVENALWSPLVSLPNEPLIITPRKGDVMSILVRYLR
jgi:hypothetical protein